MRLNPRPRPACGTYPFVRLDEAQARRLAARGVDVIDFGIGEPREETPRVHPRGARRRARADRLDLPDAPTGCPSCARRSPPGSRGASARALDPDTEVVPTLGSKEAIFRLAQVVGGRRRGRRHRRPATRCPSAARCSPAREVVELPLRAERGLLPDLDARRTGTRVRAAVAQLPEQPDRRDARRSSSTSAPRRSRASTTSCSPPTRPTPSSTSAASRRPRRSQLADRTNVARVQHAVQALVDARLPLGLRGRRPAS